jgi:FtsP/CotA-like multicopper oxidase with cupredoxin domain
MGLDTVEQRHFMFADKVLDSKCQLLFDVKKGGAHENSLWADMMLVSGQAWPVMKYQPKWYRFRLLNAGPSRPYLLQIRNATGTANIAHNFCWVIATDECKSTRRL